MFPLLLPVAQKLAPVLVLLRMALVASSGRATVARDAHLLPLIRAGLRGCFAGVLCARAQARVEVAHLPFLLSGRL